MVEALDYNKRYSLSQLGNSVGTLVTQFGMEDIDSRGKIPFTSPRLNYETYGGISVGSIVQFVGRESSGKTTTALDLVKNAQAIFEKEYEEEVSKYEALVFGKNPKKEDKEKYEELLNCGKRKVAYFNFENTMDKMWALRLGVDISKDAIYYATSTEKTTAEEALDTVVAVAQTGQVGMIVVDSIISLISEQLLNESVGKAKVGGIAQTVAKWIRKMVPICHDRGITMVVINQVIANIKNPYADFEIPCGQALRHHSDVILVFKKDEFINDIGESLGKNAETPSGNITKVYVQKSKTFKPDRRVGFYSISYDYGVDLVLDVFDLAIEFKAIEKSGGWYSLLDPKAKKPFIGEDGKPLKFQGKANVIEYLRTYPSVADIYVNYVNELIEQSAQLVKVRETEDGILIRNADEEPVEEPTEKPKEETVKTRGKKK